MPNDSILCDLDHSHERLNVLLFGVVGIKHMWQFKAKTAQGGAKLLISALVALVFGVLLFALWPEWGPQQAWLFIFLLILFAAFIGFSKLQEPAVMLELDETGIQFFHKYGSWRLKWQDVQYAKVPEIDGVSLSFVGFRLSSYTDFLSTIPVRLALKLYMEQRPLLMAALGKGCQNGQCPSTFLTHNSEFTKQGYTYRGVLGLFAHRMVHLRELLDVDLVVPADVVDYSAEEFCRIINQQRLKRLNDNCG